ncbi:MAG: hypothetical protein QOG92_2655 [Verrucomicrobiota bacterium]|jgi:hypothetical protein|nr:hypothetical protein [Verrucomicrobiota bacterium]
MIGDPRLGTRKEFEVQRFLLQEFVERQGLLLRAKVPALVDSMSDFDRARHGQVLICNALLITFFGRCKGKYRASCNFR